MLFRSEPVIARKLEAATPTTDLHMIFTEENKVSCCNISPAESLHGFIKISMALFISLVDTIALVVNYNMCCIYVLQIPGLD